MGTDNNHKIKTAGIIGYNSSILCMPAPMDKAVILEAKQISQDEYNQWRYHYPTPGETTHTNFAKVIPHVHNLLYPNCTQTDIKNL